MTGRSEREDEVREALVAWAREEDDVRAVVLVGSRAADPERVDELSDYDVVLFVSDPGRLADCPAWVNRFGDVLVELPERFDEPWREIAARLVQYRDGTKIDFSLASAATLERIARDGALPEWLDGGYEVLVDKDGAASELPAPSGQAHVPDRPSEGEFRALVEEFWWETLYVAKHLARGVAADLGHVYPEELGRKVGVRLRGMR